MSILRVLSTVLRGADKPAHSAPGADGPRAQGGATRARDYDLARAGATVAEVHGVEPHFPSG